MKKLLVFMIDALCSCDVEFMRTLPNFGPVIENGSYVHHLLPVHPALTYCCHVSILTGTYVDRHGIVSNERLLHCQKNDTWFGYKSEVKNPTLLDHAREHGLTTCSLSWPVSAGANYTYNWPMVVPYHYDGYNPLQYLENGNATQNLLDAYYWKYGRYIKGPDSSLDLLTMAIAPDLIRDFGQPDVMLIKMCDLDSVRHRNGVYHEKTRDQLRKHDEEFGVIMETLRRYGDLENTNIVIMGDHGQTDVEDVLEMNALLKEAGFIRCDGSGRITDCDCFAHSNGLSCYVELSDPEDRQMKQKVREYLESLKYNPDIQLAYVLDREEMKQRYHLAGLFDFVIESRRNISFSDNPDAQYIWGSRIPGDHYIGAATHGSCPERQENTTFIACGPSVRKGVVIEQADMVDEAPTMARMIGFEMPEVDGIVLEDMLV
ncbi:MAG: alkaline phosphatase family protein [Erysipelotrichaceae bacterium]|nr:alkaline phosphatase family protein [Erysipelotrichaceae bacterium]